MSSQSSTREVSAGTPVLTGDGKKLGTVLVSRGGYLQLDVPGDQDYWLSGAYIGSVEDDRVVLSLPEDELGEHRLHAPGLEPEDDPDRAAAQDHVISNEEALSQRERMEAELRRQRGGQLDSGLR
jgi:hypothetical protein